MDDYRNTEYCPALIDIKSNKQEFKKNINAKHPHISNYYILLRNNHGDYKLPFINLYNQKCVYCGNSLSNISITSFEIDHFINKASFTCEDKANQIENLVPACYECNRKKRGITITGKYVSLLDPEGEEIKGVFYRTNDYKIHISDQYKADHFIAYYYDQLNLGGDTRRLDHLLIKMTGLIDTLSGHEEIKQKLIEILFKLKIKRNTLVT